MKSHEEEILCLRLSTRLYPRIADLFTDNSMRSGDPCLIVSYTGGPWTKAPFTSVEALKAAGLPSLGSYMIAGSSVTVYFATTTRRGSTVMPGGAVKVWTRSAIAYAADGPIDELGDDGNNVFYISARRGRKAMDTDKDPTEKTAIIDLGDAAYFPILAPEGKRLFNVAPPLDVVVAWGLPVDSVTFMVNENGIGRLRFYEGEKQALDTSKVQSMKGAVVRFHGEEATIKWKSKYRRAVARFSIEATEDILGEDE